MPLVVAGSDGAQKLGVSREDGPWGLGAPMSEYTHVEKPFLDQLAGLGWEVIDQGCGFIPSDPAASLRTSFRELILPEVFRDSVRAINVTDGGEPWLTDRQLDDLCDQIFRQPNRSLLEANEEAHELCHFHHRDHTAAFWNEVDKVMPEYRERKEWLRKNGAGLET